MVRGRFGLEKWASECERSCDKIEVVKRVWMEMRCSLLAIAHQVVFGTLFIAHQVVFGTLFIAHQVVFGTLFIANQVVLANHLIQRAFIQASIYCVEAQHV